MPSYSYSSAEDYAEIVDCANRFFTQKEDGTYDRRYFQDLQPKIYASADLMPRHLLVRDGKRLVGLAAVTYERLIAAGEYLTLCGVGTVCVDPEYRGRGIMSGMMKRLGEDMKRAGADLAELGGIRRRYARFGYTSGVISADLTFYDFDFSDCGLSDFSFEEIFEPDPRRDAYFASLRERRPVYTERPASNFLNALKTGRRSAVAVKRRGRLFGYMSVSPDREVIYEAEARDFSALPGIFGAFCVAFGKRRILVKNIGMTETEKFSALIPFSSVSIAGVNERYRIFDYRRVISLLLRVKAALQPLSRGRMIFSIENYGTVEIISDDAVTVEFADESLSEFTLTEAEAVHILLGLPSLFGTLGKKLPACAASWFPLPMHLTANDRI